MNEPDSSQSNPSANSDEVTWWAEAADGTRDTELCLVLLADNTYKVFRKEDRPKGAKLILSFNTETPSKGQRVKSVIQLAIEQKAPILLPEYDAIFCTDSAVEKFLWPYYHSHRIYDNTIRGVQQAFEGDPNIIAAGHVPPSHSFAIPVPNMFFVLKRPDGQLVSISVSDYLQGKR